MLFHLHKSVVNDLENKAHLLPKRILASLFSSCRQSLPSQSHQQQSLNFKRLYNKETYTTHEQTHCRTQTNHMPTSNHQQRPEMCYQKYKVPHCTQCNKAMGPFIKGDFVRCQHYHRGEGSRTGFCPPYNLAAEDFIKVLEGVCDDPLCQHNERGRVMREDLARQEERAKEEDVPVPAGMQRRKKGWWK